MLMEAADTTDPSTFRETDLFRQAQHLGIVPRTAADLARLNRAAETDERPGPPGREGALHLHLTVRDMWCPACAWVIEETLKKQGGVLDVSCNFSTDRIRVAYRAPGTSPDRIRREIERLGYGVSEPGEAAQARESRSEFIRFGISAFLTLNVMMLSFSLYSGFFSRLPADAVSKISWPIFVMATGVLIYGGQKIFQKAVMGIPSGAFGMETLVGAGALCAYLYSTVNLLAGNIHLYFDTASMLITLVLLGKTIERRAKDRVQEDLDSFFSLKPTKVRVCTESEPAGRYVSADALRPGDLFRVEETETVAADGLVVEGEAMMDESSLTGEARLARRRVGDRIRSGTGLIHGGVKVRAEAVGNDAVLGQMIGIMERALGGKTALEGKTDRVLQWLVPLIMILALTTGLVCLFLGFSLEQAVIRAVTVMVISCPCALGIAIPLARVAGISMAGKRGILVRDFSAFERAESIDAVVFDKTGTLTRGRWETVRIIPIGGLPEAELLALAAGVEADSDHFIAAAIRESARIRGIGPTPLDAVQVFENGVTGRRSGEAIRVGSRDFLGTEYEKYSETWQGTISDIDSALSMVYMTIGHHPGGVLVFGDSLRPGAASAIRRLRAGGCRTAVVSGDGEKATRAVGDALGVDSATGGLLPSDKASWIVGWQGEGSRVAMVGDGVNDGPALAQSDLGIAVYSGGRLGQAAADITLMRSDPEQVVDFFSMAKRVNRKIDQNLVCSFVYNVVSIPVAMGGVLTPLVAVTAMLFSSLSVIGNTLLLVRRP